MEKAEFTNYKVVKKKGPRNNRERIIELIAKMVKRPFKQVLGLTKDWPTQWLEQIYAFCIDAPNPPADWWTLYKKFKVK